MGQNETVNEALLTLRRYKITAEKEYEVGGGCQIGGLSDTPHL